MDSINHTEKESQSEKDGQTEKEGSVVIKLTILICSCILFLMLALLFFTSDGLVVDNASLLVSALALVTTVLIGFQIWNIVDFDKRLSLAKRDVENKLYEDFKKKIDQFDRKVEMNTYDSLGLSLGNLAAFYSTTTNYRCAIRAYIQSLSILSFGDNSSLFFQSASKDSLHGLANVLREYHNVISNMNIMKFYPSVISQCLNVVYKYGNNDDKEIIISFLTGPKIILDSEEPKDPYMKD